VKKLMVAAVLLVVLLLCSCDARLTWGEIQGLQVVNRSSHTVAVYRNGVLWTNLPAKTPTTRIEDSTTPMVDVGDSGLPQRVKLVATDDATISTLYLAYVARNYYTVVLSIDSPVATSPTKLQWSDNWLWFIEDAGASW
jgi:hypothetical protein